MLLVVKIFIEDVCIIVDLVFCGIILYFLVLCMCVLMFMVDGKDVIVLVKIKVIDVMYLMVCVVED